MHGVQVGEREGIAVLAQVVADRDFAAEGIAPPLDRELIQVVRVRLHQDRHVEPGELDRVGHALLVAEVGQADQDAVDAAGVVAEEFSAALGVVPRLHAAELGRILVQHHGLDVHLGKQRQDILPRLRHQLVGEKVAVANNHRQCRTGHTCLL